MPPPAGAGPDWQKNTQDFYNQLKAAWDGGAFSDVAAKFKASGYKADGLSPGEQERLKLAVLAKEASKSDFGTWSNGLLSGGDFYSEEFGNFKSKYITDDPKWAEVLQVAGQDGADALNRAGALTGLDFGYGKWGGRAARGEDPLNGNPNSAGGTAGASGPDNVDQELQAMYNALSGDITKTGVGRQIINNQTGATAMQASNAGLGGGGFSSANTERNVASGLGDYAKQRDALQANIVGQQSAHQLGLGNLGIAAGHLNIDWAQYQQAIKDGDYIKAQNILNQGRSDRAEGLGTAASIGGGVVKSLAELAKTGGGSGSGGTGNPNEWNSYNGTGGNEGGYGGGGGLGGGGTEQGSGIKF